jgi:tight adherence protein C
MAALISIFLFILITAAATLFGYSRYVLPGRILDRLEEAPEENSIVSGGPPPASRPSALKMLASIGGLMPLSPADMRLARRELASAGIRSETAPMVLAGLRLVGAAIFLTAALLLREHITANPVLRIVIIFAGCGAGYSLPGFLLSRKISKRREQIRFALPDVLDLLVVCSDAGCALDQAILNVSRELAGVHPALSEELGLVNLEILAGNRRPEALRNLGERTGEEEVKKLAAILVQTDRFGTSVSDALRTSSDFLRVRRRQQAEERAGKVGVKLVFPIFFFCLPALLVVTAGPGMLQLMKNLLPAMREFH